jgi:hypothetical protein
MCWLFLGGPKNTTAKSIIANNPVFYIISRPIFFQQNTKCIVFLMLAKRYGEAYTMAKTENGWQIIKVVNLWESRVCKTYHSQGFVNQPTGAVVVWQSKTRAIFHPAQTVLFTIAQLC